MRVFRKYAMRRVVRASANSLYGTNRRISVVIRPVKVDKVRLEAHRAVRNVLRRSKAAGHNWPPLVGGADTLYFNAGLAEGHGLFCVYRSGEMTQFAHKLVRQTEPFWRRIFGVLDPARSISETVRHFGATTVEDRKKHDQHVWQGLGDHLEFRRSSIKAAARKEHKPALAND